MWRAYPVGWFSGDYRVEESGVAIGTLEFSLWSPRGAIYFQRARSEIRREGFWSPKFHLVRKGEKQATAWRVGFFQRGFQLAHGGVEYRLAVSSWLGASYGLRRGSHELGSFRPVWLLSRSFDVELDEAVAPELGLFAFWLVLLARRSAAAS